MNIPCKVKDLKGSLTAIFKEFSGLLILTIRPPGLNAGIGRSGGFGFILLTQI